MHKKEILEENNFYIYFFTFFVKVKIIFKSRCSLLLTQLTVTSPAVELSPRSTQNFVAQAPQKGNAQSGVKAFLIFSCSCSKLSLLAGLLPGWRGIHLQMSALEAIP